MSTAETRERESRQALPVALATFLAVALMIASGFVSSVSGTGEAEILRSVDENGSSVLFSGLLQAASFALLTFPLVYLFRAAQARSEGVRRQLIGLVIVAPLFLAVSSGLNVGARQEAADRFVSGEAKPTLTKEEAREECAADREDEGEEAFAEEFEPGKGESALAACEDRKVEDDAASNAQKDASLTSVAAGLGIAGALGFAVVLFYACLWAMRTGLLPRFWGSLGMALGIAALLGLLLFTLIWFIYFGLLILGKVPGGKPPAWETGEAVPWPTPGEKAAAELEPQEGWDEGDSAAEPGGEKRKRKQRE
ncbi:MAG TPA: hypothetical protein VGV69_05995 [Solirubrobacterales bacterium]|nr:hypothetical protein [Solirubrobacterales bacterium]